MLCRLLFALILFPLVALAQGTYEHAESKFEFPAKLATFQRIDVTRYEDPRLGVKVAYLLPGLGKADFYVFDFGLKAIPEGIGSEPVRMAYGSADRDIHTFVEQGRYVDFKQILPLGAVLRSKEKGREWHIAAYQFTMDGPGAEPMASWLLVRGERGFFLKVRFSHRADRFKEGQTELNALLDAFSAANVVKEQTESAP